MVYKDYSLKSFNTFGLDIKCRRFHLLNQEDDLAQLFHENKYWDNKFLFIGSGSNLLFSGNYDGDVIHLANKGIDIEEKAGKRVVVKCDAGVIWDDFVSWCVERNFGGIENLSLIPGTAGASPVQNIGAYGSEVKDSIEKVKALDTETGEYKYFTAEECGFAYRQSIFRSEQKRRYIITAVWFRLTENPTEFTLSYGDVGERVKRSGQVNLENIRKEIISIRREKLPDPSEIGNAGSFFKNPIVSAEKLKALSSAYPGLPYFPDAHNSYKIPAAWMIEHCGWKGMKMGNVGVHHKQALVLINHGGATGREILELSQKIIESVKENFGIDLTREVIVV